MWWPSRFSGWSDGLPLMLDDICRRVKSAAKADVSRFARGRAGPALEPISSSLEETTDRLIAVGASTGGVEALSSHPAGLSRRCARHRHRPAHADGIHGLFRREARPRLSNACERSRDWRPSVAGADSVRARRVAPHDDRALGRPIPSRSERRLRSQLFPPKRGCLVQFRCGGRRPQRGGGVADGHGQGRRGWASGDPKGGRSNLRPGRGQLGRLWHACRGPTPWRCGSHGAAWRKFPRCWCGR